MSDNERMEKLEKGVLDMLFMMGSMDARIDGLEAALDAHAVVLERIMRILEKEADSAIKILSGGRA